MARELGPSRGTPGDAAKEFGGWLYDLHFGIMDHLPVVQGQKKVTRDEAKIM